MINNGYYNLSKNEIKYIKLNKSSFLSTSIMYIISIIFIYVLFGPSRIKRILSFSIEGSSTTNEIWIIPLLCLIMILLISIDKKNLIFNKYNLPFIVCVYLYIIIILIGGFNINSFSQYIYAALLFITPIFLFFPIVYLEYKEIEKLIKFFVISCLIYSILAIILSTNYAYFMNLVGNVIDDRYYSQYRASMMLGSSITVSYFFNLTLPLCFYLFYSNTDIKWRFISGVTIFVTIIATFVLLSRTAVLCTLIIIIYSLFFMKKRKKKSLVRKIGIFVLIITAILYTFKNYDLTRIINGMNFSGESVEARLKSSNLGIYIFTQFPLTGSGMGAFFKRVYDNKYLTVDGLSGLIDPHNMYVLILSELGLIGIFVTIIFFVTLVKKFSNIKDSLLKHTAYITVIAFLFDSLGGSQLVNEISFASIFWIYMGIFSSISFRKNKENMEYRSMVKNEETV